jgi:hypothetical protein
VNDPITQFLAEIIHQRDGLQADLIRELAAREQFTEGAEGWALHGLVGRLIPECRNRFRAAYALAAAHARQERAGLPGSRLSEALDSAMEQHERLLEAYVEAAEDRRQHVPAEIWLAHGQEATRLWRLWPAAGMMMPEEPFCDTWEVEVGTFRYGNGEWHILAGKPLRLLRGFVAASNHVLTHDQIRQLDDPDYETDRIYGDVADLNSNLLSLMKLSEKPIKSIRGEKAYKLHSPIFLQTSGIS